MKYISTRGGVEPRSFSQVVMEGLAPGGGLFMPETIPAFSESDLERMKGMSYPELAFTIIKPFVDDIPEDDLEDLINKTYTEKAFGTSEITPLVDLGNKYPALLDLFEGPTEAFKDIALQFLGNLFEYILSNDYGYTHLNILGATSGDTGSAAIYGTRGKESIRIFIMKPRNTSIYQAGQMDTVLDENVFNMTMDGNFDTCQKIMKAVSSDEEFKSKYNLGAINSTNWARVMAQIVYYFAGSLRYQNNKRYDVGHKLVIAVPSGNYGDILAGDFAKQMGAPIDTLILATNENKVLADYFNRGIYKPWKKEQLIHTTSPSMEITLASNFERKVFWTTGCDGDRTKELMQMLDTKGYFSVQDFTEDERNYFVRDKIIAGTATVKNVSDVIQRIYQDTGVIIDPHTATGYHVAMMKEAHDCICLATASPVKFEEALSEIPGVKDKLPLQKRPEYQNMESKPKRVYELPEDVDAVRDFIVEHALMLHK
ncbi:threonine synthase [Candidatus Woesearchaeota archaeon]|nr:threonine synthase [Candidatus Woesearchaeota archaeon]